jgi:CO dehydrogenase nickel-insertion accessory protein CooC1
MSKLIAVWGSPNSGKTCFGTKLAQCIYEKYNASVLMLSTDYETPTLPVLFPNAKADETFSVGVPLSKTDIVGHEVVKSIVTVKGKMNLGFLGYKDSENKFTYPSYDNNKAKALLTVLKGLVDFVIVDCTSSLSNILSTTAVEQADTVIRLATPDLKSISYFSSQLPLYADPKYKMEQHIVVLNTTEKEVFLPVEESKTHFKNISFTLPYCRTLREQNIDGDLLKAITDKRYIGTLKMIAEKVV